MLSQTFFGQWGAVAAMSMYPLGLVFAVTASKLLCPADIRSDSGSFMLIELPDYRMPGIKSVAISVWDKLRAYFAKAGSIIFLASLILWILMNTGPRGPAPEAAESFAAYIGKMCAPLLVRQRHGNFCRRRNARRGSYGSGRLRYDDIRASLYSVRRHSQHASQRIRRRKRGLLRSFAVGRGLACKRRCILRFKSCFAHCMNIGSR